MKAIVLAAFIAVCTAAKLDRSYLPPANADTAGGTSDILQVPVSRTNNQVSGDLPIGSYLNDHQGVIVDAAVGTRASNPGKSGLGAPRITYGSKDSRVGDAAFRDKHLQGGPSFLPQGFVDFSKPERAQASSDSLARTVKEESDLGVDMFNYGYETSNGISASETGVATNGVEATGQYSFTGDDGQVYTVMYTADKGGYQAVGAHLPTPPPVPEAIMKALEQNAKDEAAGIIDDGSYDAKKYNTGGDYTAIGDNDSQSNKFANRPGSSAQISGGFINQNNEALKPNDNGQFGFISGNKDTRQPIGNVQISQNIPQGFTGSQQQNQPLSSSNSGDFNNVIPTQSFSQSSFSVGNQQPSAFQQNIPSHSYFQQNTPQGTFAQNAPQAAFQQNTPQSSLQQNAPQATFQQNTPQGPFPQNVPQATFQHNTPQGSFQQNIPSHTYFQQNIPSHSSFQQNTHQGSFQQNIPQGSFSNEYLPPQQQFVQQTLGEAKPSYDTENSQDSNKLTTNIPLSQQDLQNQDQGVIISSSRPSSYDTSISDSVSTSSNAQKETVEQKPQSNFNKVQINQGAFNSFGSSQSSDSSLPTTVSQISSSPNDGSFQQQFTSSFNQQTIVPTNQPSKELTTPFEMNPTTNIDDERVTTNTVPSTGDSFQIQSISQVTSSQGTGALNQIPEQENAPANQPSNTYEGEIYNYNKPDSQPKPTDAALTSNIVTLNYNKGPDGAFVQISEPFQKPIIGNQNIQISSIQARPTDASLPVTTTNNQYEQTETETAFTTSEEQNTAESENLESDKPTTNLFAQTLPTDATFEPSTQGQSFNQYTQSQNSFNTQVPSFQNPFAQANQQPVQNSFQQTRPTSPAFLQTQAITQNQYTQPQGPDGSYYYDRPAKPFNQPQFPSQSNQFNKIPQRPEFSGQPINAFAKPTVPSMLVTGQSTNTFQSPINGLTQATISSFGQSAQTSSINNKPSPTSFPFNQNTQFAGEQGNPHQGSIAEAFAYTQQVASQQNNIPQGFGQTTNSEAATPVNTDSEIYQYNKPEQSLPSTSSSESNEEGSGDQAGNTFAALPTQNTNQQPSSSLPQNGAISKPEGNTIAGISGQKHYTLPLGSSILGSACCGGHAQFTQNYHKFNSLQTINRQQQPSQIFTGPEKFEINRKPPSFDSTGYHY
ncbi:serine-rich adhesin for platelets-like isoform X2 [Colias croceus]|uniref:serine-rich adhesin for platelets-like isoform X2 n=1 Tax=Colias crocea TaxID=72248 RepID=UPI001E27FED6|nr:serine-rich adhesin for platelets-like isoform X2 [Colias croceus]